jgi:glycosyltransferase involved in cell wall biosynthesis/GT2 family glycosyltransferase
VATWEIEGPSRNAGVGSAYTSLVDALKHAGHDVTVLFLLGCHPTDGNITDWVNYYKNEKGIQLIPLPMAHDPRIHAAWASSVSYHTYVWLKAHQEDFDIIHFPECQGLGFYSLLARRQGLAFRNSLFVVGTHGPTMWVKEGGLDNLRALGELEIDYMERMSVAAADVVVSPSQYLLNWMKLNNWELTERTYVTPYVLPKVATAQPGHTPSKHQIREAVFFGRLELRKGLEVFCDALDELSARGVGQSFEASFLGKETFLYSRSSISYISERAKKWSMPWKLLTNKHQAAAIEYLRGPGRMAVVASLADNYPNTVLECLGAGVPLLAANVGGIPEIIAPEDREKVCFQPQPFALVDRIQAALDHGLAPARPALSFSDVERKWIKWHGTVGSASAMQPSIGKGKSARKDSPFPLVSICFARDPRAGAASATFASLKQQDYPNLEIVVADCGGTPKQHDGPEKLGSHTLRHVHSKDWRVGVGRNVAAKHAKGEYLFFVDDHTLLIPSNAVSVFAQVAQRVQADVLTSALSFYIGPTEGSVDQRMEHSRRPFLGGDVVTGAFINSFGSSSCLIRKEAFEQIGGFDDEAAGTLDDWEIFSKAGLAGLRVETMPEVFVWYREDPDQDNLVHSIANAIRSVRCYTAPDYKISAAAEPALRRIIRYGQGMKFEKDAEVGKPLSRGEQGPAVTG